MKYKLLLVDDDPDILAILSFNLKKEGFDIKTASNGKLALDVIKDFAPDLVLLDIMMPVMDGLQCCRELRKDPKFDNVSILFLTAKGDEDTHIAALDQGGDDFVEKPVSVKVLLSRIKALIRRKISPLTSEGNNEILSFDTLTINPLKMEVQYHDKKPEFAKKEFLLLYLLASNPGRVFKREEILDKIWGKDIIVGDRTIDVHVRKLREKLDDSFIKTIKGVGYKFEA
ncbi:MAG: response regulator transcription factor [Saprospiraceae bacterium]|nr:response regulator transcription factor [Saprospiraceae bacterium]